MWGVLVCSMGGWRCRGQPPSSSVLPSLLPPSRLPRQRACRPRRRAPRRRAPAGPHRRCLGGPAGGWRAPAARAPGPAAAAQASPPRRAAWPPGWLARGQGGTREAMALVSGAGAWCPPPAVRQRWHSARAGIPQSSCAHHHRLHVQSPLALAAGGAGASGSSTAADVPPVAAAAALPLGQAAAGPVQRGAGAAVGATHRPTPPRTPGCAAARPAAAPCLSCIREAGRCRCRCCCCRCRCCCCCCCCRRVGWRRSGVPGREQSRPPGPAGLPAPQHPPGVARSCTRSMQGSGRAWSATGLSGRHSAGQRASRPPLAPAARRLT